MFSHQFSRHSDVGASHGVLGYEQLATDITAYIARLEPDSCLEQVYNFGLLQDFDHLYRYANPYSCPRARRPTGSWPTSAW